MPDKLLQALEAVLIVSAEPVSPEQLAEVTGADKVDIRAALKQLRAEYAGADGKRPRGFVLREVAAGWRIYSSPEQAETISRFVLGSQVARLSQPALETLAIIAYRQPATRAEISAIRGVNVDSVVRTLLGHGLISEIGHSPSGAVEYGTTSEFLERAGLDSLEELPPLAPFLPDQDLLEDLAEQVGEL